jgi:hypothetical protein
LWNTPVLAWRWVYSASGPECAAKLRVASRFIQFAVLPSAHLHLEFLSPFQQFCACSSCARLRAVSRALCCLRNVGRQLAPLLVSNSALPCPEAFEQPVRTQWGSCLNPNCYDLRSSSDHLLLTPVDANAVLRIAATSAHTPVPALRCAEVSRQAPATLVAWSAFVEEKMN